LGCGERIAEKFPRKMPFFSHFCSGRSKFTNLGTVTIWEKRLLFELSISTINVQGVKKNTPINSRHFNKTKPLLHAKINL
jgi:hypothetical protein